VEDDAVREPGFHYGWAVLLAGFLAITGALGIARFGYTMILPGMKEGLSLTEVQAADLATGNMIGYLLLSVTGGYLASRFGPRAVVGVSLFVVSGCLLLTGLAQGYWTALLARTITGVGSGGAVVPAMGLLSSWFVSRRRGLASGIAVTGSSAGLLATGILVPLILARRGIEGWRSAWFVLAAFTLVIASACSILMRNHPEALGLRPVGEDMRGTRRPPVGRPSEPRRLYRLPALWHLAVIYSFFGFSYVIYSTFFARHLTGQGGYSTAQAGALWSLVGAVSVMSGFLWGAASDRFGRKIALTAVFLVQGIGYLLFGLWQGAAGYAVSALLYAVTAWSVPAVISAAGGDVSGPRLAPAALGFMTLFFGTGQAAGPFVAGRIAQATGSYTAAFVLAGAVAVLGAVGSLLLRVPAGRPAE